MNILKGIRYLDSDGLAKSEITIDFDSIDKLEPDHIGDHNEPCFRVEFYDAKAGYDKVIYIKAGFKVS